mgnify:CR=1 FL=1
MKTFLLIVLNIAVCALYAQEKMNPIIKNYNISVNPLTDDIS